MTPEQAKTLSEEFLQAGRSECFDSFEYFWEYAVGFEIVRLPSWTDSYGYTRQGDIDTEATIAALPAFLREWADALEKAVTSSPASSLPSLES